MRKSVSRTTWATSSPLVRASRAGIVCGNAVRRAHQMPRRGNTMPISRRTLLTPLAATPLASLLPRQAFAAYPDKPIRLIVPFAAGGNADLVARLVAEGMSPSLGQTIVVESRAGAGGSL